MGVSGSRYLRRPTVIVDTKTASISSNFATRVSSRLSTMVVSWEIGLAAAGDLDNTGVCALKVKISYFSILCTIGLDVQIHI